METIQLNSSNCKEYTDAEIATKIAELESANDFDMDGFWDAIESNDEVVEVVAEESDFVVLTKKLLAEAEAELEKWINKSYKKTKGSVYVGDEMDGQNMSFNRINEGRRTRAIKNAMSDIKQYKKDLGII